MNIVFKHMLNECFLISVDSLLFIKNLFSIRCEVDNQAGMAQWTRSGFALGKPFLPHFHLCFVLENYA